MKKVHEKVRGRIAFAYLFLYYIVPIGLIMNRIKIDAPFNYIFVMFSAAMVFAFVATHLDETFPASTSGILSFLLPPIINSGLFIFFFGLSKFREDVFIQGGLLFCGALCGLLISHVKRLYLSFKNKKISMKKSEFRWAIAMPIVFLISLTSVVPILLSYAVMLEGNNTWVFLTYAIISIVFLAREQHKMLKGVGA